MANLSIRKLEDETVQQLRVQAAKHGVSMEEEVRCILKRAVSSHDRLGDLAVRLFSPTYDNEDFDLPEREDSEPLALE